MENMPLRRRDSAPVPYHRGGWAHPRPHLRRDWAHPLKRLHWDWARPSIICTGAGLTPCHISTETGLTPRPHLHRDLACRQSCGFAWQDVEQCKAQYAAQDGEASRSGHGEASRCRRPLPSATSGRLASVGHCRRPPPVGLLRSAGCGHLVGQPFFPQATGPTATSSAPGLWPSPLQHLRRDWPSPLQHLRRDWPSPLQHLRRDRARPAHICAGT